MNRHDKEIVQNMLGTIENLNQEVQQEKSKRHIAEVNLITANWSTRYKAVVSDLENLTAMIKRSEYSFKIQEEASWLAEKYSFESIAKEICGGESPEKEPLTPEKLNEIKAQFEAKHTGPDFTPGTKSYNEIASSEGRL